MTHSKRNPDEFSYEEVLEILDAYEEEEEGAEQEHPVVDRVAELVAHYSTLAGDALKQGKDYLPLLTPAKGTTAVHAIAMELVLEIMEDELEGTD